MYSTKASTFSSKSKNGSFGLQIWPPHVHTHIMWMLYDLFSNAFFIKLTPTVVDLALYVQ